MIRDKQARYAAHRAAWRAAYAAIYGMGNAEVTGRSLGGQRSLKSRSEAVQ